MQELKKKNTPISPRDGTIEMKKKIKRLFNSLTAFVIRIKFISENGFNLLRNITKKKKK